MTARLSAKLGRLALGLALMGLAQGGVRAASIQYSTVGTVGASDNGVSNLVYFNGINNGAVVPPDSIDLGKFVISGSAPVTDATYTNTPFQIIASAGGDASEKISGVLNGVLGPNASPASLTATITSIGKYGNNGLPFDLILPLNTPLKLALNAGSASASTSLTGAATLAAVPEPSSIAVFAVALGGLAGWRRRRPAA